MRKETTLKHAYASGTRRGCPCCLPVNSFTKRQERRLERRLANKLVEDYEEESTVSINGNGVKTITYQWYE